MRSAGRAWLAVPLWTALAVAACFIDNPGPPPAGSTGTATTTGSGGHGTGTTTTPPGDAGDGGDAAPTICTSNGGYGVIEAVVADMMTRLENDCSISAYFTALPPDKKAHLADCLTKQLAVLTHCPNIKYDVDSNGQDCRDMKTSHHGLAIRGGDFQAFVEDLHQSFLSAGYSATDWNALSYPLQFYSTDIVTNSAPGFDKSICDAGTGG